MYCQVARKQTYLWRRIYMEHGHGAEANLPGMVINLARQPGSQVARKETYLWRRLHSQVARKQT
jgi:hypothetical protein